MRTKFLKIGMPIMVFMLAIVFAFATEKTTAKNESLLVTGYIFENGQCKPARDCNNQGNVLCVQGLDQVYMLGIDGTSCPTELTHWP